MILEAERHRYDAVLSDISGQDIEVHGNDPDQAIRCVRNWLSEHRPRNAAPLRGATGIQARYRQFQMEADALLVERDLDALSDLTHNDFTFAVHEWITKQAAARLS